MDKNECLNIFERYVSKKASPEEIERLRAFINQDKLLSEWLESEITNSSSDIAPYIKLRMLENIKSNINTKESPKSHKRYSLSKVGRIAATILLPIILAIGIYTYTTPDYNTEPLEVTAEAGEKAHLTLPDGSRISLNSDSKIMYYNNYNIKERFLRLNGEAYFEVKPDSEKPFIVECLDLKLRVLGTSFGVRAYDNDDMLFVVITTGRVEMTTPTETFIMNPNERIGYNRKTKMSHIDIVDANDYVGWRHNRLRFENESLKDITVTLSRMHNIDIIFEDQHIGDLKYTGTIDNTSIESVLTTISLTSPVHYKLQDSVVVLFENKQFREHFN